MFFKASYIHEYISLIFYSISLTRIHVCLLLGFFEIKVTRLPWWLSDKDMCLPSRRRRFNPWVGKIPWSRKWQPTLVFLPGEPVDRGAWRATVRGVRRESDTTEWLNSNKNNNWSFRNAFYILCLIFKLYESSYSLWGKYYYLFHFKSLT